MYVDEAELLPYNTNNMFKLWPGIQKYQMLKPWNGFHFGSKMPGFGSHSAVVTAKLGGGSYKINSEKYTAEKVINAEYIVEFFNERYIRA